MRIGSLTVSLSISDARSLKDKRRVLRSLKDRLFNNFNIAVAEVGSNDKWQIGELGIVTVANDGKFVNSVLEKVKNFIASHPAVRIIDSELEIF